MRIIPNRAAILLLWSISVAILPKMSVAQTGIEICAHPMGNETFFMDVEITVSHEGAKIEVSSNRLKKGCYLVNVPICSDSINIEVVSGRIYAGEAVCENEPSPLLIAMSASREEIIFASLKSPNGAWAEEFDSVGFLAEIDNAPGVLMGLPVEARNADAMMFAALANNDYATAQRQASEVATFLRLSGEERLSLAYSSITYVSGFRAIGFDALAAENPLVTTVGSPDPSFVVMSREGRNILEYYQAGRSIGAETGVWDHRTTAVVSTISSSENPGDIVAVPKGLSISDFYFENSGRMLIQ